MNPVTLPRERPICQLSTSSKTANAVKEFTVDAIYYPEDCADIVEGRAEKIYNQLGDIAEKLFEKPWRVGR